MARELQMGLITCEYLLRLTAIWRVARTRQITLTAGPSLLAIPHELVNLPRVRELGRRRMNLAPALPSPPYLIGDSLVKTACPNDHYNFSFLAHTLDRAVSSHTANRGRF